MNLFNHTKLDNKILKRVILEAAKAIGAAPKTMHVPIKVVTARGWAVKGTAYKGREVSTYFMNQRQGYRYKNGFKMIKADGFMVLKIPIFKGRDGLKLAEYVFLVIAHEWRHIRDVQKGLRFDSKDVLYHNRCQEIRAMRSEKLAEINLHKMKEAQEAVLDLAINIEELAKEKKEKEDRKWKKAEREWRMRQESEYMKTAHGKKTDSILKEIVRKTRIVYG